ncbi:spermidine synthase [Lamprobacter modestohalophilus]|uniref:spermidine synthase n=1 Tax=Lamprobacter modestohalophilus TaxID=1064514 RepID=UPI002ADEE17E|nr:spermidine synthase [Lamprobacter modestohalophilus]MCF8004956.1 spermidine synthase [Chromatiaceae bacterium]MEA1052440.1 spermidine synthase [Lamprobacter modestohalophilus]
MRDRFFAIAVSLLVWCLAGALFGGLFIGLYEVLVLLGLSGWQPLVVGAVTAAMTTAAFYSAMPLALVGATAGVLASIGYLVISGQTISLAMITLVAAGSGLAAGAFFAWTGRQNARPLAETLTGMLAGFGAGLAMVVVLTTMDLAVGPFVMAAGVVAIVGTLFQLNEHWIVQACHGWLPDSLAAPLVAGLIASVVGAAVWLMAGMTTPMLFGGERSLIDQVLREVPTGALGGMLGGAATGLILELMGFRLEDHDVV